MRQVRFQAWDKGKKMFIPTDYWAVCMTDFGAFGVMIKDWEDYIEGEFFYDHSQELSQFTGLLDKNGKEVYEGDIFKWGDFAKNGQVMFEDGCFVFRVSEHYSMTMRDHSAIEIEVIGNIYEQPDLLTTPSGG